MISLEYDLSDHTLKIDVIADMVELVHKTLQDQYLQIVSLDCVREPLSGMRIAYVWNQTFGVARVQAA